MSIKVLYLGDPHVTISNIDESDRLMDFVIDQCIANKPDRLVILGDLFHTFSLVRTEVIDFWMEWLETFSDLQETVVLVGNHDMANSGNDTYNSNALNAFKFMKRKNLKIISNAQLLPPFAYVPYIHNKTDFVTIANAHAEMGAKTLVCHEDINGCQYENGFYAPDGVDPDLLNFDLIIGGHIHKRQRFGKVILPGTARWMTTSDANEEKGLWLVTHKDDGSIEKESFIDTSSVCTPIIGLEWKEGEEMPKIPENSKVNIELVGSSDWITVQKAQLKGRVSIKTRITDKAKSREGLATFNLEDFTKKVYNGETGLNEVLSVMKEIGII